MLKYLAQAPVGSGIGTAGAVSNIGPSDVGDILNRLTSWLFTAFTICAVIAIIYAAFLYITAGEKAENVRSANRALIYAIIAFGAALLSGSISKLVFSFLKI